MGKQFKYSVLDSLIREKNQRIIRGRVVIFSSLKRIPWRWGRPGYDSFSTLAI